MTPEQASRGLSIFYWNMIGQNLPDKKRKYADLSKLGIYDKP